MSATTPPAMVFRSSYVRVRRLLVFMLAVSVALAIALILVATSDESASNSSASSAAQSEALSTPVPESRTTACGYRFDSPGFVAVPCENDAPLPH